MVNDKKNDALTPPLDCNEERSYPAYSHVRARFSELNVKFICDTHMYLSRLPLCVEVGTKRRVWSISTLRVGPDQTDPKLNPHHPNPDPLGGSRSARGRQGQSCHAFVANELHVHVRKALHVFYVCASKSRTRAVLQPREHAVQGLSLIHI